MTRFPVVPSLLVAASILAGCGGTAEEGNRPDAEAAAEAEAPAPAGDSAVVSGTVYVADYSHIYYGSDRTRFPLTTTLSVRNTDPERSITVLSVRYYNSAGELARRFLEEPRRLGPLGTADFVVAEHDISGGTGANFIVEWSATRPVSRPLIESVMIGTRSGQGISLTSRGQPIDRSEAGNRP